MVALVHGEQGVEALRVGGHGVPRVPQPLDPRRHGRDGEGVGLDLVELVPREGCGDLGAGAGSDRPGAEDGLVWCVLVEVDKDPLAPLLLPPRRRDQVGAAAFELPGHRHRCGADLVGRPLRNEADVHMYAPIAGGLRQTHHAELVEQAVDLVGRFPHHREGDAGRRIEVDPQLVGVIKIGRLVGPDMESQTAQVDGPDHVGHIGGHQGLGAGPVGGADDCGLQPIGPLLRDPLLEERRSSGPVGKALQEHGPSPYGGQERRGHGLVVVHQVELGVAPFLEKHLLRTGDHDRAPVDLDDLAVGCHRR